MQDHALLEGKLCVMEAKLDSVLSNQEEMKAAVKELANDRAELAQKVAVLETRLEQYPTRRELYAAAISALLGAIIIAEFIFKLIN